MAAPSPSRSFGSMTNEQNRIFLKRAIFGAEGLKRLVEKHPLTGRLLVQWEEGLRREVAAIPVENGGLKAKSCDRGSPVDGADVI